MKIKLMFPMAGPKGCFKEGSVVEMEEKSALHLIETGQATDEEGKVVKSKPEPENSPVVETATKPQAVQTADSQKGKAHANKKDKSSDSSDSASGDESASKEPSKNSDSVNG